jgi:hypothetical protein
MFMRSPIIDRSSTNATALALRSASPVDTFEIHDRALKNTRWSGNLSITAFNLAYHARGSSTVALAMVVSAATRSLMVLD